ncbi:hypothetical protein [Paenibacillus pini]|uniref:Uncharacterized protein n=1 Tax=Paenibacillus pini JCM 16418 TaxID=1236976 RepID=W7YIP9_9BACL|nr:hypothetical protein [Paenibacillus pini]GAF10780.1 hypothetical protein JCM16418_5000 [Paenibacillus pini JCM 16418]
MNIEQIQRELSDYSFLLDQVPLVYEEVAGLSKTNYYANAVINEFEKRIIERFKDYLNEILDDLKDVYDVHIKSDEISDVLYADGINDAMKKIKEYMK